MTDARVMPDTDPLLAPLTTVVGSGAKGLREHLGLTTVGDLLGHLPRRYVESDGVTDLSALRPGDHVTVVATVARVDIRPMRDRPGSIAEITVTDGTAQLSLTFFMGRGKAGRASRLEHMLKAITVGQRGLFAGEVGDYRGKRQLTHPDMLLLRTDRDESRVDFLSGPLIPIYPATSAMSSWAIHRSVSLALAFISPVLDTIPDPVPPAVRRRLQLRDRGSSLIALHAPRGWDDLTSAQSRWKFDEAFILQVILAQQRHVQALMPSVARRPRADGLLAEFDRRLPFRLTAGQQAVGRDIAADLGRTRPMHRLLQGDVGSGKTVVALRAMLSVIDSGGQAALLAPTEVLAHQHARTITALLGDLAEGGLLGGSTDGTRVALLTGSATAAQRRRAMLDIVSGDAGIVVGTHALLESAVEFHELALVVVDEQHRFGVEQRAALAAKSRDGMRPHVLVMTATPIPRTVAVTVFGDLDTSTLDQLPEGRAGITTHVVPAQEKPHFLVRAWERVRQAVGDGHQAYIVCPRIGDEPAADGAVSDGDGDAPGYADSDPAGDRLPLGVLDVAARLAARDLHGLRIGILHGRLPADVKDDVMRRFTAGPSADDGIDVLVSTTVIEVGVDVPNATVMVVLDAERFGISQLHQLRGRVGRGREPGLCLLVTDAAASSPARERLDAVASTTDGFELSRLDLALRREGDILGAAQSGRLSSLRLLEVLRDGDIIERAREAAMDIVAADPELLSHPDLRSAAESVRERADYLAKS